MRPTPFLACLCLAAAGTLIPADAFGQRARGGSDNGWDVTAQHGPTSRVRFSTDEGTWMSLDVSPDGRQIVFDLLGDLYLLPIEGGQARPLSTGPAWEVQPRFSPDGTEVAFTSDRGGGNNLWRIGVDGRNPAQVSNESFRLLNTPAWTPDGQYLVGRKHFTSRRSLGAGELWMYHRSGGQGLQITERKNDQQDLGEPAVSADGRWIYFSEDVSPGPTFQYNKDPHGVIYAVKRFDRETGEIETVVQSPGGAVRPQPSPDGRLLAFVKRVREHSVLHVMELDSGLVRPVWDGLSHDQQEAWAIFGPYPGYAWTPDSNEVVVWAQGQLWRVDIASGQPRRIPFTVDVDMRVTAAPRARQTLDDGDFQPRMIRDVATSPDGRTVVFHAVGALYTRSLPGGTPRRLTGEQGVFEYQPAFSPDGSRLLYTTWSDQDMGAIHEIDLASGQRRTLTTQKGFYYGPRYANDGSMIVYSRTGGGGLTGSLWSRETGIFVMPADGGEPLRIARRGANPQFDADGGRVYFMTGGGQSRKLMSVGVDGRDEREVFDLKDVNFVEISPDGRWVAFTELFNAYVAPMPRTGRSIALNKDTRAIPVTRVSRDVGSYLHWSADSSRLHWMVGREYFTREVREAFSFVPGAPRTLPEPAALRGVDIGPTLSTDRPGDVFAFTNARVITMRDAENTEEVIEDGTVVVRGNRIAAVGPTGQVAIPDGARVIDASGRTIIPGLVDAHAHAAHFGSGVVPQQNWAYYANLAFGVTTLHDPSATTEFVFSQAELVRAGAMVGPRIFSTGTILYGADGDFRAEINSLDDARAHLRRMQAHGAFSVKSYNQPRRDQRQQVIQAARELDMLVVEEGGSTFHHNMSMVVDGATGVEHNIPIAPLHRDIIELWRQTGVGNVPTLVVSYGGLSGEYWFYARDEVFEEERLQRFFPRETLDQRAIRREIAPDWDYHHIRVAEAKKALRDAGVRIMTGGHGQMQGLALHWEIWMLTQGGFSNFQALRAATIDGADYIRLDHEFGSLEPGKRADLVVLDGNPLEDIRDTAKTAMVMVDGRLFDLAQDMAEVGGLQRPAPEFYWQRHRDGQAFGLQFGPTGPCHCPKSGVPHRH
ncbi:MAG: amidohydrolase family protein [Lysobacteraceae bacterium]